MLDEDLKVDLSEVKDPAQTGVLVATRRLTDESWQAFRPGELIVFKDGQIVYSSHRQPQGHQARLGLSPEALSILRLLRASTHGVRLSRIARDLDKTETAVKQCLHVLLCSAYIQQNSLDTVEWHHGNATFFTIKSKRNEIDDLIR
jgi:glutamine amidotransferase